MKQTFKKPSYYLLSQAMDGDEKATPTYNRKSATGVSG